MNAGVECTLRRTSLVLAMVVGDAVTLLAAPKLVLDRIPGSSCGAITAPGAYEVTGPITSTFATCSTITASGVTLLLYGQVISCVGPAFLGRWRARGPGRL